MLKWKSNNGYNIYWFKPDWYKENIIRKNKGLWLRRAFHSWSNFTKHYENGYILPYDVNVDNYLNNFITSIPEKATLYFDKSSKFPRTKISLTNCKRCTKLEKADFIVINNIAEIYNITDIYYIFTNGVDLFAITWNDFDTYFNNDLQKLQETKLVGLSFHCPLKLVYSGKLKLIFDESDVLKLFNENKYKVPFILDKDLTKIVNSTLPDPTLTEICTINEMLNSSDNSIIKLGALMAASFNINKWPLTFRVLLQNSPKWKRPENGGNTIVIKQLSETLNIEFNHGGLDHVSWLIQSIKEVYSEEDIELAKSFVKTLPELERFCKIYEGFYLDTLPFIPDEYKQ